VNAADSAAPFVVSAPASGSIVASSSIVSLNADANADFQISIPDVPSDLVPAADVSTNSARAIPLPPAIQSGITGMVAIGLAAGVKRFRRTFR
jgi:hypothetical protein